MHEKLTCWLKKQDARLVRFKRTVPLEELSREIGEKAADIRAFIARSERPVFHTWEHTHRKTISRTKPYCLRLAGPGDVCLDWEESVVGAAEAIFKEQGYDCRREIGTKDHIAKLCNGPSLDTLVPGVNKRDLLALKKYGDANKRIDLYILEAKGKQASGFDFHNVACALGQVFPIPKLLLNEILGDYKKKSEGYTRGECWSIAQALYGRWSALGFHPTITLGLLLPNWKPDVVWNKPQARTYPASYFERPLSELRGFLEGVAGDEPPQTMKQSAFRRILADLEERVKIKALARAETGLRFRLLSAESAESPLFFRLSGLETPRRCKRYRVNRI